PTEPEEGLEGIAERLVERAPPPRRTGPHGTGHDLDGDRRRRLDAARQLHLDRTHLRLPGSDRLQEVGVGPRLRRGAVDEGDLLRRGRAGENAQVLEGRQRDVRGHVGGAPRDRDRELHLIRRADAGGVDLRAHRALVRARERGQGDDRRRPCPDSAPPPDHQSFPWRAGFWRAACSFFCCAFSFCWRASRSCMARSFGIPVSFSKRSRSFSSSLFGRSGRGPPPCFWSCFCWLCCWFCFWSCCCFC